MKIIPIVVKTLAGKIVTFDIKLSNVVHNINTNIQDKEEIPLNDQI